MKGKIIKTSSVLMILIMIFTILTCAPFSVSAAESNAFVYKTYEDGTCAISGYKGSSPSVNIPSGLDGYVVVGILERAFKNKTNIKSVTMPDSVEFIYDEAFLDCAKLESITISPNMLLVGKDAVKNTAYYNNAQNWEDGMLYLSSGKNFSLAAVNVERSDYSIKEGTTVIADRTFYRNSALKSCKFPSTLMSIGNKAFYDSNLMGAIYLPEYLMFIGDFAFYDTDVKTITIPDSAKYFGESIFYNCTSLKKVSLPQSMEYIPKNMFYSCWDLKSVEIPSKTKYILHSAFAFSGLEEITIPNNVELIAGWAFNGTQINKITLPNKYVELYADAFRQTPYSRNENNWVNGGLYVGNYLIDADYRINSLKIKDGTKYVAAELCKNNDALNSVTIPESVEYIGNMAFFGCVRLNSVTIPKSVKHIGTYAFGVFEEGETYYLLDPFKIVCIKDSTAYKYAKSLGITTVDGSKASSISINRSTLTLGVGEIYTLTKTVTPTMADSSCKWSSSNTAVATVNSNGTVTAKSCGTATITVKTSNNLTKTCKVTVKSAPKSVSVSTSSLTLGVGEEFEISESTNSSSYSCKITWSSSDSKVATVTKTSGNKAKIVAKGKGTANITVKTYNGKTATCKVTVKPAPTSVSLSNTSVTLGKGETFIISHNLNSGSYARGYSWSSTNSNIAKIEKTSGNKAKITAKDTGTAVITFKTYNGRTATCMVTVKKAPTSVKINTTSVTLGVGETYTISESTNSGSYANVANIKWSSTNSSVATVVKDKGTKAKITAKGVGTAYIKITLYNGKTAQCKVTVKSAPKSVSVSTSSLTLGVGESFEISESTNSGSYSCKITWSSSDSKVATVTKTSGNKAKIVAKGTGTANITVKTYNGKTATCKVTVKPAPTSITLSNTSVTLGKGETLIISHSLNSGSYARGYSWSSSNSDVAKIEKTSGNKAKITAKEKGTATITIKTYNGKTATCKVTVKNAPTSVKINTTSVTLGVGETYTISESTNSGSYANVANIKWSSTNSSVATVVKDKGTKAKITAKGVGTAYIKITLYNGKTAQCKVTVKTAPKSVKLTKSAITLNVGEEFVISESTNSGSYANKISWSSSNSKVATVTKTSGNKAKIVAKGKGTANITVKTYNGKTATCKVYVKQ